MAIRQLSTLVIMAAAFVAAIIVSPASAEAHDFDPERQLLVQVFPDRVDILILYMEAPGERSAMFSANFGFGFGFGLDGELGEAFAELAGRAILPRMLDGLEFEVAGERPRANEPEVNLREEAGRVMAAAIVTYDLPILVEEQQRTFIVRSRDQSILPTRTLIYEGDGLQRVELDDADIAPTDFFELDRAQQWQVVFELSAD